MNLFSFIKSRLSILDVIGQYTTLKKAGSYYKSCCPFHAEKTASFTVSPNKEIFYCFGCHTGGDLISFISKAENCSQIEAAKHLIDRYSIDIPQEYNDKQVFSSNNDKKRYYDLCSLVSKWAHEKLLKNSSALLYLKKRNINKESIINFNIGYFEPGYKAIKDLLEFIKKSGFLAQDLIESKIIFDNKSDLYSPFEDRIIFPITDHLGRYCAFGARIFKDSDTRVKYYNSHEHNFFNKSNILFGLDKAKKIIQERNYVFLVEGYTDVIAMFQADYQNSVATLGTACSQTHLTQISHYTDKIYILYDGDPAGQKAISRLTQLCWEVNLDLFVIILPEQEDPASFLEKNRNLQEFIDKAQDIFEFFINTNSNNFKNKSLSEKLNLTNKILELICQIKDNLKKDILLQKTAELSNIPFNSLLQSLNNLTNRPNSNLIKKNLDNSSKIINKNTENIIEISLIEKKLISGIIYNDIILTPDDEILLSKWLSPESLKFFNRFLELKQINYKNNNINNSINNKIFDIFREEEKKELSRFIIEVNKDIQDINDNILLQFYKKQWKLVIHDIKVKIENAQKSNNLNLVKELLIEIEKIKKIMINRGIK